MKSISISTFIFAALWWKVKSILVGFDATWNVSVMTDQTICGVQEVQVFDVK